MSLSFCRYGNAKAQQDKDSEKYELCKQAQISLIQVPYWWDGSTEELKSLIDEVRPEVLKNDKMNE